MDYSSREAEELFSDFRSLIGQSIREKERLHSECKRLQDEVSLLEMKLLELSRAEVYEGYVKERSVWYREWKSMQSSLSWKLTKPLRFIKKLF